MNYKSFKNKSVFQKGIANFTIILTLLVVAIALPAVVTLVQKTGVGELRKSAYEPMCAAGTCCDGSSKCSSDGRTCTSCGTGKKCQNGACVSIVSPTTPPAQPTTPPVQPTSPPQNQPCGSHASGSHWCEVDKRCTCSNGTKRCDTCTYGCANNICKAAPTAVPPTTAPAGCGTHPSGSHWCGGSGESCTCTNGAMSCGAPCTYGCNSSTGACNSSIVCPCTSGSTQNCTVAAGIIGKQTCVSKGIAGNPACGSWGTCLPLPTPTNTPIYTCNSSGGTCLLNPCSSYKRVTVSGKTCLPANPNCCGATFTPTRTPTKTPTRTPTKTPTPQQCPNSANLICMPANACSNVGTPQYTKKCPNTGDLCCQIYGPSATATKIPTRTPTKTPTIAYRSPTPTQKPSSPTPTTGGGGGTLPTKTPTCAYTSVQVFLEKLNSQTNQISRARTMTISLGERVNIKCEYNNSSSIASNVIISAQKQGETQATAWSVNPINNYLSPSVGIYNISCKTANGCVSTTTSSNAVLTVNQSQGTLTPTPTGKAPAQIIERVWSESWENGTYWRLGSCTGCTSCATAASIKMVCNGVTAGWGCNSKPYYDTGLNFKQGDQVTCTLSGLPSNYQCSNPSSCSRTGTLTAGANFWPFGIARIPTSTAGVSGCKLCPDGSRIEKYSTSYNCSTDGMQLTDFLGWRQEFLEDRTTKYGDFNCDDFVDLKDFLLWRTNYLTTI